MPWGGGGVWGVGALFFRSFGLFPLPSWSRSFRLRLPALEGGGGGRAGVTGCGGGNDDMLDRYHVAVPAAG